VLRPVGINRLSPSQIGTWVMCPRQWYYDRMHVPQITTETKYADAGSVIHQSIAEYLKVISPNPSKGAIEGTFRNILNRRWKESGLGDMGRKEQCAKNFIQFEVRRLNSWKQFRPTYVEETIGFTFNGTKILTIVDAYWQADATVIDWKTGNMNRIDELSMIQGLIVKKAIESRGLPVERMMFVSLKLGLVLTLPKPPQRFLEDIIDRMIVSARQGKFPKRKGSHCDWCGHQLRCQFGEICLWSE